MTEKITKRERVADFNKDGTPDKATEECRRTSREEETCEYQVWLGFPGDVFIPVFDPKVPRNTPLKEGDAVMYAPSYYFYESNPKIKPGEKIPFAVKTVRDMVVFETENNATPPEPLSRAAVVSQEAINPQVALFELLTASEMASKKSEEGPAISGTTTDLMTLLRNTRLNVLMPAIALDSADGAKQAADASFKRVQKQALGALKALEKAGDLSGAQLVELLDWIQADARSSNRLWDPPVLKAALQLLQKHLDDPKQIRPMVAYLLEQKLEDPRWIRRLEDISPKLVAGLLSIEDSSDLPSTEELHRLLSLTRGVVTSGRHVLPRHVYKVHRFAIVDRQEFLNPAEQMSLPVAVFKALVQQKDASEKTKALARQLLQSPQEEHRMLAANAIPFIFDADEAIPFLLALAGDSEAPLRWRAYEMLAGLSQPDPRVFAVFDTVLHQNGVDKPVAMQMLAGMGPNAVAYLQTLTRRTESMELRLFAYQALVRFAGDSEIFRFFEKEGIAYLTGLIPVVVGEARVAVYRTLSNWPGKDSRVIAAFRDGLEDSEAEIRLHSVRNLVARKIDFDRTRAIAVLEKFWESPMDAETVVAVSEPYAALTSLQGVMDRLVDWVKKNGAPTPVLQLMVGVYHAGKLKNYSAVIYDLALKHPKAEVWQPAILALAEMEPKGLEARLQKDWENQDKAIQSRIRDMIAFFRVPGTGEK